MQYGGQLVRTVKYFASTDNAGKNVWVGASLSDLGLTEKKLTRFPAIMCSVTEAGNANDFFVVHANRTNDTYITILFNKANAASFQIAFSFLVENA